MSASALRKAVVGLGNPGAQYYWTRHNLGFLAVDHYLANFSGSKKTIRTRFSTAIRAGTSILAKPSTFMNRSGLAVAEISVDFGVPLNSILIVYDDYALAFGTIRVRKQGGAGGHNGMKSIIAMAGSNEIPRLRLGIADENRRDEISNYVLEMFSKDEEKRLPDILDRAASAIDCFLTQDLESTMNRFNV